MKENTSPITASVLKLIILSICYIVLSGCASRQDPVRNGEGTLIYPPKAAKDIDANVLLYKGTDHKDRLLAATTFTTGRKSKVYARVNLLNRELHTGSDVMVHMDWIDPEGNSFFIKKEYLTAGDTATSISSAISIPSERREPGAYKFRVYLFRELVVEKNFSVVNYNADSASLFQQKSPHPVSATISFGNSRKQLNEHLNDTVSTLKIKNKTKVFAGIKILNREYYNDRVFDGEIKWFDETGSAFYRKTFSISPYDSSAELSSVVSANSNNRKPGKYSLKVYLYEKLIGEKNFILIPEQKKEKKIVQIEGIDAGIIFCSRVGKKSGKAYGISNSFSVSSKGRVYTVLKIADTRIKQSKSSIKIEWISPAGVSFHSKTFKFAKKIPTTLTNSISLTKDRRAGTYTARVYYNKSLIAEKSFIVTDGID